MLMFNYCPRLFGILKETNDSLNSINTQLRGKKRRERFGKRKNEFLYTLDTPQNINIGVFYEHKTAV